MKVFSKKCVKCSRNCKVNEIGGSYEKITFIRFFLNADMLKEKSKTKP